MSHQKNSMHDTNSHEAREHREWIDILETWQIEHQEALAKLTKMKAALMEHDAEIAAQLAQIRRHDRFIEHENKSAAHSKNGDSGPAPRNPFGSAAEHREAHRALRTQLKQVRETHRRTHETLRSTIETMRGIHADSYLDDFDDSSRADEAEMIHQAGVESFPASDPPSFNPSTI